MGLAVFNIITFSCFLYVFHGRVVADEIVDYYWREYNGVIPEDAIVGGYDVNNRTTYIGQGFVLKYGIIPGTIYPGERHITVPIQGITRIDSYVKILCSLQLFSFKWIPAEADRFHVQTSNKRLILGGVEKDYELYIGRVAFQGEAVIGKVVVDSPDTPGIAPMYFVGKGRERRINFYEVLSYDPKLNFMLDNRQGEAKSID